MLPLRLAWIRADNTGMATHPVSPAYQQIIDWYQRWQTMEMAQPIPMLITSGAPDEAADEVKDTSAVPETLDIYA